MLSSVQFGQVIAKAGWSKAWKDTTSDMWNKQITELSISIAELPGEVRSCRVSINCITAPIAWLARSWCKNLCQASWT